MHAVAQYCITNDSSSSRTYNDLVHNEPNKDWFYENSPIGISLAIIHGNGQESIGLNDEILWTTLSARAPYSSAKNDLPIMNSHFLDRVNAITNLGTRLEKELSAIKDEHHEASPQSPKN